MIIKTILILPFLSFILFSYGQKIETIKLDNKQSILNDKVFFQFPSKAVNSARQADIMSADPNTNKETRIMLDIDKMRLVFFAQELYVSSDNNLLSTVSKDDGVDFKSRILTDKDSILSILTTPTKFDSTKNAILINSLLVKTQDNSVFKISAYINPDAFKRQKRISRSF